MLSHLHQAGAGLGFVVFQRDRRLHFEMHDEKVWDHGSCLPNIGTWIESGRALERERERERERAPFFLCFEVEFWGCHFFLSIMKVWQLERCFSHPLSQKLPGLDLVVSQPEAESQVGLDLQICLEQWWFHVSKPRCPHQPWALAMESIRLFGVGWLWLWLWWRKVNNPKVKLVPGVINSFFCCCCCCCMLMYIMRFNINTTWGLNRRAAPVERFLVHVGTQSP